MAEEQMYDAEPKNQKERAGYWTKTINQALKFEEQWRERCMDIIDRYRDDSPDRVSREIRMNILYSNTDTLKSALYYKTPRPKVNRRYRNNDPVARTVATVLERALEYQLDVYNFDTEVRRALEDMLLVGRGVLRMRYEPIVVTGDAERITIKRQSIMGMGAKDDGSFGEVEIGQKFNDPDGNEIESNLVLQDGLGMFMNGDPVESVEEQNIRCEYVFWQDFVMSPVRCWNDTKWIAFRHLLTRSELIDIYGQAKGQRIPLTYMASDEKYSYNDDYQPDRAEIYEIWDKRSNKQIFVAMNHDEILEEFDDPYNLEGFWPMPEPLYAISTNDTSLPVPEFFTYEDQVRELDIVTQRIGNLTEALKRRGVYDASFQELQRLAEAQDNEFVPVDAMAMLQASGGLAAVMQEAPLDNIIRALAQLYQSRQSIIQTIYEITGISDIMRGQSASRETATAQRIKGQFGAMRLVNRQRRIEQFLDNIMELKAELLVENLEPNVLQRMTSINITPEMVAVMRDDRIRSYRIKVDTDESAAIDNAIDQQRRTEFLTASVQFLQAVGPLVSSGVIGFEQAKQMLLFSARSFPGARELEESLEAIQPPQPRPDPTDKIVQLEQAKLQADTAKAQADADVKLGKLQLDQQKAVDDRTFKQQKLEIDAAKIVTQ